MSLIKCPECGKEISSEAKRCIHCGYRKGLSKKTKSYIIIALMLQIIAVAMLLGCKQIYVLERNDYYYVDFGFGSENGYSGYHVISDNYADFFLVLEDTRDPEVDITPFVSIVSYLVLAFGGVGILVTFCSLIQNKVLEVCWLSSLFTAGILLAHSILISVLDLEMIGIRGYYEITPAALWFLVMALEIIAAVLDKKAMGNTTKCDVKEHLTNNEEMECFVDSKGILHYREK